MAYLLLWLVYLLFLVGIFIYWDGMAWHVQSGPFCVLCGKKYATWKKVHQQCWWRWWQITAMVIQDSLVIIVSDGSTKTFWKCIFFGRSFIQLHFKQKAQISTNWAPLLLTYFVSSFSKVPQRVPRLNWAVTIKKSKCGTLNLLPWTHFQSQGWLCCCFLTRFLGGSYLFKTLKADLTL